MKRIVSDALDKLESLTGLDMRAVKQQVRDEQRKPLSAAIFGQTGCGKSSLTNAIFGTSFDVDDVKPCTKEPQAHEGVDNEGNPVTFWDLPGIGESEEADCRYLDMYAEYAASCDVVLWAFQADTRTMTLDSAAVNAIVIRLGDEGKSDFLNRLSVIITKADVISTGPWIFAKSAPEAIVAASRETEETLERKAAYFFDGLLGKYRDSIVHRTFVSSSLKDLATLPTDFWLDNNKTYLYHRGIIQEDRHLYLLAQFPRTCDELKRLYKQSKAVYCSARLKFNLNAVKAQIAEKGRGTAMLRLHQSVDREGATLSWQDLKRLGLPVFWDRDRNRVIFNIEDD